MVLAKSWPALVAAAIIVMALALGACIKSAPVQRLSARSAIAVAFVNDQESALEDVPREFAREVAASLDARNLAMNELPLASRRSELQRKRATQDRLETVSGLVADQGLLLLVETRAEYYSQLGGRYRWTVHVTLSLARKGEEDGARVARFTVPVMMSFDHQREQDALVYAAGPVATRLGQELDNFLAGLDLTAAAPLAPTSSTQGLGPIYFVMVDRFHNGDSKNDSTVDRADPQAFHGGDLAGLIDKLDYIKDMGFGTVWVSPIFAMRTDKLEQFGAFHGYWTEDLRAVEPRFGDLATLAELREQLAARDMNLVMDVVLNHVGHGTKLVTEKPQWFHHEGDIENWDDPVQMTTHDVHGLPDLAQERPEVYDYLLSASAYWVETLRPAGFRLDAVKHVGNDFWRRYIRELGEQAGPGFVTIGELYDGNPANIAAGFAQGGFSHLFDFPLYYAMTDVFCRGQDMGRVAAILSLDRIYPDPGQLVTFADNHDLPRVFSACGKDRERVAALLTFLLTARGVPCINYGTEVALDGTQEPANRQDMIFSPEAPLRELITRLLSLRREHPVLASGASLPIAVSERRYAYFRVDGREAALIAVNLGNDAWSVSHALEGRAGAVDGLTGARLAKGPLAVAPGSVRVALFTAAGGAGFEELAGARRRAAATQKVVIIARAEGKELRLVGAGPELGGWDPSAAPRGKALGDGRFRFEVELPGHATVTFKLVRAVDGQYVWEQRDNRFLVVAQATEPIEIQYVAGQ